MRRAWIGCLLALVAALVTVGIESRTPLRHLIQLVPALAVLALAARSAPWAADAALPVFAVWLALMTAVWLYLVGAARVVTGRFPPLEVALTVVIGAASAAGLVAAARASTARWPVRALVWLAFAALQLAALWLSFRRGIAAR